MKVVILPHQEPFCISHVEVAVGDAADDLLVVFVGIVDEVAGLDEVDAMMEDEIEVVVSFVDVL